MSQLLEGLMGPLGNEVEPGEEGKGVAGVTPESLRPEASGEGRCRRGSRGGGESECPIQEDLEARP